MDRRHFISALSLFASSRLLAQPAEPEHPVVNDDRAHHDRPAGVNAVTEHVEMEHVAAPPSAGVQLIATRSGSSLRHGAYHETRLTPAVVHGGLRKLAQLKLPGDAHGMDAQPLFAAGVSINGQRKDLILCATLANRIHAFDCATYKQVWMTDVGKSVLSTNKIDYWGTNQHFGIMSTPEIVDGKLYVVAWISPDATREKAAHFLHEIRLSDGKVLRKLQLPGASTTVQRKQRSSLASSKANSKRTLFVPFGTIQETAANAHGFITAVDIDSFTVSDELNLTRNGSGAGVWMAGQAPTVLVEPDASGRQITYLVLMTGNGDFDPAKGNFAECFVKARFDGTFSIVDWWSPWLDDARGGNGWDDMDLAAGGPIVVPELGLVLGAGKDSILYSLDWRKMGKPSRADLQNDPAGNYARLKTEPVWFGFFPGFGVSAAPNDPQQLNKLFFNKTHHQHGSPIYWPEKKLLYTWCENGNLRVGEVQADGKWKFLARSEEVASPYSPVPPGGMPGGMMCLSRNGATDGVIWGCMPDKDANRAQTFGRVFAFDAANFGERMPDGDTQIQRLWMSDPPHVFAKFNPPVVNDGRLWVPCYDGTVGVWGV